MLVLELSTLTNYLGWTNNNDASVSHVTNGSG